MRQKILSGAFALMACLSIGCGSSDSSSSGQTNDSAENLEGVFIDAAVNGMHYECSSGRGGITKEGGKVVCQKGDTVIFYLADVYVAEQTITEVMTPYSLFDNNEAKAVHLAMLLLALDDDGDTDTSIDLDTVLIEKLKDETLDFDAVDYVQTMEILLGKPLASYDEAKQHLDTSIEDFFNPNPVLELSVLNFEVNVSNFTSQSDPLTATLTRNNGTEVTNIEIIEIDYKINPSTYIYSFENLEGGFYNLIIATPSYVFRTLDLFIEPDTAGFVVAIDFHQQETIDYFTEFTFEEDVIWSYKNCTDDTLVKDIRFRADHSIEEISPSSDPGFSDTDVWSITQRGSLNLTYEFQGTPIATITHTPLENDGQCYTVNSTQTGSNWNKVYKLCSSLNDDEKKSLVCN